MPQAPKEKLEMNRRLPHRVAGQKAGNELMDRHPGG
jgi:hypothetical protein